MYEPFHLKAALRDWQSNLLLDGKRLVRDAPEAR
jgi:hypothetical protein